MDKLDVLFQVTCLLSIVDLPSLACCSSRLSSNLLILTQNQEWWYRRVEYLVASVPEVDEVVLPKMLASRLGDWKLVFDNLSRNGFDFNYHHDYSSYLLISVLLEIGADPSKNGEYSISEACHCNNLEGVRLLLTDPRISVYDAADYCLVYAIENKNRDMVQLLLDDGREGTLPYPT